MSLTETIQNLGLEYLGRYYSKYKGVVVDNQDELNQNKLMVSVPGILGGEPILAAPSNQHGGMGFGFKLLTPKVGELVWVEFEQGIALKAIWSYYGWAIGECPEELNKDSIGIITPQGNKIILNEKDGNLTIEVNGPVLIKSKKDVTIEGENVNLIKGEEGVPISNKIVDRLNKAESALKSILLHLRGFVPTGTPADGATWQTSINLNLPPTLQIIDTKLTDIASEHIKQPR